MNTLRKLIPVWVMLLAAVCAFAFTQPKSTIPGQLFAHVNGTWQPIPDVPPGTIYLCDEAEVVCTAKFLNDDPSDMNNLIPASVRPGSYIEL